MKNKDTLECQTDKSQGLILLTEDRCLHSIIFHASPTQYLK